MPTLIDRLRSLTSTIGDDFYDDLDLVESINQAKNDVVSYYSRAERQSNRSFRVLDRLRASQDIDISNNTYDTIYDYYKTNVSIDNNIDSIKTAIKNGVTPVQEIPSHKEHILHIGKIFPTKVENFYTVTNSGEQGLASFSLPNVSFPYTATHIAFVGISDGQKTVVYDGVPTNGTWFNKTEMVNSFIQDFKTSFDNLYPNLSLIDNGDSLSIQTKELTDDYNNDTFEIYLRTTTQPQTTIQYATVDVSFSGNFAITVDGTVASVGLQYSGETLENVLTTIKQGLNNESITTGINVGGAINLPSGFVASNTTTNLIIKRNDSSALDFNVTRDNTNDGGITAEGRSDTSSKEFNRNIEGGVDYSTDLTVYTETNLNQNVKIEYIKIPKRVGTNSDTLLDLPERLTDCVLYKAAIIVTTQESQKNVDETIKVWSNLYQEQLQNNQY